jgi:hypothetical protein
MAGRSAIRHGSSPPSKSAIPSRRCIRSTPPRCTRALLWKTIFDEQLGPALRAAIVTPLFRYDPDLALRALTTGMPDKAYQTLRPLVWIFPAFYRFRHKISDSKLEADRATVNAALDRIEQERQGRAYLVGDAFTVADLTAAAMLGALLQPPEIQYPSASSCRPICRTTAPRCYSIRPRSGRPASTGCIAVAPRKSRDPTKKVDSRARLREARGRSVDAR